MSNDVTEWSVQYSLEVIVTLFIIVVLYYTGTAMTGRIVKRAVQQNARRHAWHRKDAEKRQNTLVGLFRNVWKVFVVTVGAFVLFSKVFPSVNLAPLFASAGIIGVAFGFGAQSLVKDFLSGIFIISENQYRVGDIVEIEGAAGTVERIGARSTVLRDADGNVHYFPNGMVQHVINKTMGYSMARFSIGVHPSSDLEEVIEIINNTGTELAKETKWKPKILEAPAFVSVGEFTSTAVNLLISGKTQPSDQWSVTAEMRRRLLLEFEDRKIGLGSTMSIGKTSTTKKG